MCVYILPFADYCLSLVHGTVFISPSILEETGEASFSRTHLTDEQTELFEALRDFFSLLVLSRNLILCDPTAYTHI